MSPIVPNSTSRPSNPIAPWRRVVYHLGQILIAIGLLLFVSVFFMIPGFMQSFDPSSLEDNDFFGAVQQVFATMVRAPLGLVIVAIGGGLMVLGRAGAAGSGLTLDPEGARSDLQPWNEAQGGMIEDTLAGSPTIQKALIGQTEAPTAVEIKVRCHSCQALNDETAKYCGQCGAKL